MRWFARLTAVVAVALMVGVVAIPALARGERNPNPQPVIYVESQDLYYDSIVLTDLPWVEGAPYQELYMTDKGLTSTYGPGDVGYVGGRWWVDTNFNGYMDTEDHYFMCPLLGPGFEMS